MAVISCAPFFLWSFPCLTSNIKMSQLTQCITLPTLSDTIPSEFPFENSYFTLVKPSSGKTLTQIDSSNKEDVDLGNILVHYRVWSNTEAKNLGNKVALLVHGFGGSTFCWENNVQALCAKFRIVVGVDLPGFGFSSRMRNLDHSRWNRAFWTCQLMSHISNGLALDATAQFTLMCHSMGCSFLPELIDLVNHSFGDMNNLYFHSGREEFAREYILNTELMPCFRIEQTILVSGSYIPNSKSSPPVFITWPIISTISKAFLKMMIGKKAFSMVLKSSYTRKPTERELEGYSRPTKLPNTVDCLFDMTETLLRELRNKELENQHLQMFSNMPNLCDIVMISGEMDSVIPLEDAEKAFTLLQKGQNTENKFKLVYHMFEEASHLVMESHPDAFDKFVLDMV